MTPGELLMVFALCLSIGGVSALLGLGGGVFLVPALTILCGLPIKEAAGVALIATLATSAAGSVALDKAKLACLPVVAHLELASATGALLSAHFLATRAPGNLVAGLFAGVVAYAAYKLLRKQTPAGQEEVPDPAAVVPQRWPLGLVGCGVAGVASGLLGIGGGPIKVPVQTQLMGLPLRVALANSNLMVGITAGAGAAAYYVRGDIPLGYVAPCGLGTAIGAFVGGKLAPKVPTRYLTRGFGVILIVVAVRMAWKALEPAN